MVQICFYYIDVPRPAPRLQVGDLVTGNVQSVLPYGAFIDLGGVTGLLHVSQISHGRIDNLAKILSDGDQLKVHKFMQILSCPVCPSLLFGLLVPGMGALAFVQSSFHRGLCWECMVTV